MGSRKRRNGELFASAMDKSDMNVEERPQREKEDVEGVRATRASEKGVLLPERRQAR